MKLTSAFFPVVFALVALAAQADDLNRVRVRHATIDGVTWNYVMNGSSAMLGSPSGSAVPPDTAGRVVVPGEIDGFRVGGFIIPLFRRCENLEEVDLSQLEGRSLRGTFFHDCPALRRVVFPRRPYMISGWEDGRPFFENCPAIEEIVFPGSVPPEFRNLGVSLDGRLRVGREFERAWRVFAEDHEITGWKVLEEAEGGSGPDARPSAPVRPVRDLALDLAYAARDPACKPLEQLSSKMIAAINAKKKEMQGKEESLRRNMQGALERAKAAAQAGGDLDGVLLFDEAAKNPDANPKSDNETLREIFKTRDQAKAGYRVAFDQDCARILSAAVAQLDRMKAEETKKGNIPLAKEVAEYQKSVQSALDGLERDLKHAGVATGAAGSGPAAPGVAAGKAGAAPAKGVGPAQIGGVPRTYSVPVDKEGGMGLGRFEQGEIIVVQYLSGTYRPYRGSSRSVNPDANSEFYYSREGTPLLDGPVNSPNRRSFNLPRGTASRPFVFVVPESGHYNLKCYSGSYSEGKVSYKVTKLDVLASKEFQKNADKSAFQWRQ